MKRERHFFNFRSSLLVTGVMVLCTAGCVAVFTKCAFEAKGEVFIQRVIYISLISVFLLACFYVVVIGDGWPAWNVVDDRLVVTKLLRRKRSIPLSAISTVLQKKIEVCEYGTGVLIDGYSISDGKTTVEIPKAEALDALVDEIRRRNGI